MIDNSPLDVLIGLQDQPWAVHAACREADPTLFFPGQDDNARDAKRICGGCAVRPECLDFAMGVRAQFGIWGGTTPRERRRLRRQIA